MSVRKTTVSADKAPDNLPKKRGWGSVIWSILWMLMWVWIAIFASQIAIAELMILCIGVDNFSQPVWMAVFSALSYIAAMFLIIVVPPKVTACIGKKTPANISREVLGLKDLPTWTDIGLAVVGFVVYLMLAAGLTAIFSQFVWFDAREAQDVGFSTFIFGFDRIVAFLTLVVVAPIAEEIIFRGWLYGKIREKLWGRMSYWGVVTITALLVSVLFGIVHEQWNVGVNVFAMSLVLCALREITGGSIYAGILLHILKNGVAFYLLYVLGFGV